MISKKNFYLTTTLPYVNADPHIGFALEIVQADIIARFRHVMGDDVFFNTGTDEHGLKIYRKALEVGKDPQDYVDEYAKKFQSLKELLNLYPDIHFIRTTDSHHKKSAQDFWNRCKEKGDIYKKNYKVKYCVGCELEKTDSDLTEGKCPIHPNLQIEIIEEENYFFKFSRYQDDLLSLYKEYPDFVLPDFRFNEIKTFVEGGLEDFSISRLKSKMPWGVPVPGDEEHVMYVWFDALINYISTLGWPENMEQFERFWGTKSAPNAIQYAGKDNIRQQSAMWQAMLLSAGLPVSRHIVIHGFITSGGQKMSKSLGNVIDPSALVEEYGQEPLRYFLARHMHPFEDSDFTLDRFAEAYNAHLANGLGNVVSRVMKMASSYLKEAPAISTTLIPEGYKESLGRFEIQKASDLIWQSITELDQEIQKTRPFELIKKDEEKAREVVGGMVQSLYTIGMMLYPFMPETSKIIKKLILENRMPSEPLFPRKD